MTYKECTFEDRLTDNIELHDKSIRNLIMENISKHLILYGPCGVGKYTLALSALQHNSPSRLKYYKKLHVLVEKTNIFPSKGEAKKMIQGGGLSINRNKVDGLQVNIDNSLLLHDKYILVQKGKKNYYLVICD